MPAGLVLGLVNFSNHQVFNFSTFETFQLFIFSTFSTFQLFNFSTFQLLLKDIIISTFNFQLQLSTLRLPNLTPFAQGGSRRVPEVRANCVAHLHALLGDPKGVHGGPKRAHGGPTGVPGRPKGAH